MKRAWIWIAVAVLIIVGWQVRSTLRQAEATAESAEAAALAVENAADAVVSLDSLDTDSLSARADRAAGAIGSSFRTLVDSARGR